MPLLGRMISDVVGRPVVIDRHPEFVTALGAARLAVLERAFAAQSGFRGAGYGSDHRPTASSCARRAGTGDGWRCGPRAATRTAATPQRRSTTRRR